MGHGQAHLTHKIIFFCYYFRDKWCSSYYFAKKVTWQRYALLRAPPSFIVFYSYNTCAVQIGAMEGVCTCHPRSNQTNLTGTKTFSAERFHSWSFHTRSHSNSEQHCTMTTRLWSSNLCGLCRSACCLRFTQSFFALVTADRARDSRQDSQISKDPVQQLC